MDFSLRTQLTERIREELSNISRRAAGTESKKSFHDMSGVYYRDDSSEAAAKKGLKKNWLLIFQKEYWKV